MTVFNFSIAMPIALVCFQSHSTISCEDGPIFSEDAPSSMLMVNIFNLDTKSCVIVGFTYL